MNVTTGFELWDRKTANLVLDVDRLDEAVHALRDYIDRNGPNSVEGLSLLAVSSDGEITMTLAEDGQLVDLLTAAGATRG